MEHEHLEGARSSHDENEDERTARPRTLPDDLPTSLDDRRPAPIDSSVEVYDAWQGQTQLLTNPLSTKPLSFNLPFDSSDYDGLASATSTGSNGRFEQMLAAQASHREDSLYSGDVNQILTDKSLSEDAKKDILQRALTMAASNGDVTRLRQLLSANARQMLELNTVDDEGTAPLIYASCFGHEAIVTMLLDAGADVNKQDRHEWTSLMWATANRHRTIIKLLLDRGASPEVKSSSGRTAFDFVDQDSDISTYLNEKGYSIGTAGVAEDFYSSGVSQDRFEEEMAENEMKRRMMMESAINLEVDLGNLGLDEHPETPEEIDDDSQHFVWDRCLNDQMFVFQESELERILDTIITNMTPQRSPSQKPVPANILFLSARYAHYHANPELLETLFVTSMDKINDVIERHQWDMTILAFWISNATLLLHYLKKDAGLHTATPDFQAQLAELINEIFVLIIRDAERRMDKVLDTAMLDHETIPGFEDVHFQNEWRIFRSKNKTKAPEPMEKRFMPPTPKERAKTSPRNITSLLSSTLFVLDLYDIHSVITTQIISQLFYWLGAELFNRIMSNRKYLARTKAMQVRMNISVLEDWARSNNRRPEHYDNGSTVSTGETTMDSAAYHLGPVVQLLQWLQIFSALGENTESLENTIQQLPRLSPQQLLHAVRYYRAEVGEKGLPKPAMKYLNNLQKEAAGRKAKFRQSMLAATSKSPEPESPNRGAGGNDEPTRPDTAKSAEIAPELDDFPEHLLMDPALMLPFSLPTSTDMLISYGAGFGGKNRERERKYVPTVPPEFLAKLDMGGHKGASAYRGNDSFDDD